METHHHILEQGVEYWNNWRDSNKSIQPVLNNQNFSFRNLEGINLYNAILSHSCFDGCNLKHSNLYQAECFSASFQGTILDHSTMSGAKLHEADFSRCSLRNVGLFRVDFINTLLDKTDFSYACCDTTAFSNVNLNSAIGLNFIRHYGPSNIDISTIYRLKEPLPKEFLKGAGIPDNFIDYISSFTESPIKFYDCFISYNEYDEVFSTQLYEDLINRNIRCWRWKEDAKIGIPIMASIDSAIKSYDKLILICSKNSLNSPAVLKEIERALLKEDSNFKKGLDHNILFPITIDHYIFKEWDHFLKADILKKRIGDFSQWQDNKKYRNDLEILIKCIMK